jgi:hypothetical protein
MGMDATDALDFGASPTATCCETTSKSGPAEDLPKSPSIFSMIVSSLVTVSDFS